MKRIIVSRHAAAIAFIRRELPAFANAPVLSSATAQDVAGAEVAGNLPLDLAAQATVVFAITFAGTPPRGQEYSLADMDAAGASLKAFRVSQVRYYAQCRCHVVPTESGHVEDCALHDGGMYDLPFSPQCAAALVVESWGADR